MCENKVWVLDANRIWACSKIDLESGSKCSEIHIRILPVSLSLNTDSKTDVHEVSLIFRILVLENLLWSIMEQFYTEITIARITNILICWIFFMRLICPFLSKLLVIIIQVWWFQRKFEVQLLNYWLLLSNFDGFCLKFNFFCVLLFLQTCSLYLMIFVWDSQATKST